MALASQGTRKLEEVLTATTRSFDISPSNGSSPSDPTDVFTHPSCSQWQASTLATRPSPLLMSRESSNLLVSSEEIPGDNKAGATLSQYLLTHVFTLSFFFNILEAGQVPLNNDVGSVDDEGDMSR